MEFRAALFPPLTASNGKEWMHSIQSVLMGIKCFDVIELPSDALQGTDKWLRTYDGNSLASSDSSAPSTSSVSTAGLAEAAAAADSARMARETKGKG